MLFCGAGLVALMAVALTSLGATPARLTAALGFAGVVAAPRRAGDPDPLRPLAGGTDGGGDRLPGRRAETGWDTACSRSASRRSSIRRCSSRSRSPSSGSGAAGGRRSSAWGSSRPWRSRSSCRSSSSRRAASGTACSSREAARCRSRASGAAVLLALHHLFGLGVTMVSSHGSQNLGGSLPTRWSPTPVASSRRPRSSAPGSGSRAASRDSRALRPRVRARRGRLHRAREGALAAVPDLAHPARPARVGTARVVGLAGSSPPPAC